MTNWKAGAISLGFLGAVSTASAQEPPREALQFPLRTANGQTVVDCTKLEKDGSIGLEFLQALDRGFHADNAQYRPAFSQQLLVTHLQNEGLKPAHYQFIITECSRRQDGQG
jgi:hypothetical protein